MSGSKKLVLLAMCVVGLVALTTQDAQAGPYYPGYWGLDARVTWTYTTVQQSYYTGYWGGWWNSPWRGYNWLAYMGYYHTAPSPYYTRYGLSWGGWPYFYGFRDKVTYTYTYAQPRLSYWWTYHWDDPAQGQSLDLVTMGDDGTGQALPFPIADVGVQTGFTQIDHEFDINDSFDSGSFGDLYWVDATHADIETLLKSLGLPAGEVTNIMASQVVLDVIANNQGGGFVGVSITPIYDVPEPVTASLLALGGLALLRRRKRRA